MQDRKKFNSTIKFIVILLKVHICFLMDHEIRHLNSIKTKLHVSSEKILNDKKFIDSTKLSFQILTIFTFYCYIDFHFCLLKLFVQLFSYSMYSNYIKFIPVYSMNLWMKSFRNLRSISLNRIKAQKIYYSNFMVIFYNFIPVPI